MRFTTQRRSCGGFSYLGVLFLVVFIGIGLGAAGTQWSQTRQREKERELLFVGGQFRQALDLYYQNSPGKVKKFPQKLDDLLQDNRFPDVRRYLRRIYLDPMTNSTEWGLLRGADKGIVGVYSVSGDAPIKIANFDTPDAALADRQHYYQWRFIAKQGVIVNVAAAGDASAASPAGGAASPEPAPAPAEVQQSTAADAIADAQATANATEPPPPNELPPEQQRSDQCNTTFIHARTACFAIVRKSGMASASNCFQAASAQYAQCLK